MRVLLFTPSSYLFDAHAPSRRTRFFHARHQTSQKDSLHPFHCIALITPSIFLQSSHAAKNHYLKTTTWKREHATHSSFPSSGSVYLSTDGSLLLSDIAQLPNDNNEAEHALRRVAVGRKNWLFVGSEQGGERTAIILTIVASAHRHDLDVWAYLRDVLERLTKGEDNLEELLPDVWKAKHPEHVRDFRTKEREDRAAERRYRRAKRRIEAAKAV